MLRIIIIVAYLVRDHGPSSGMQLKYLTSAMGKLSSAAVFPYGEHTHFRHFG